VGYKKLLPGKKGLINFKLSDILNAISTNESARDVYVLCRYSCEKVKQQNEVCCPVYAAVGID
jgi:hypothetical protein